VLTADIARATAAAVCDTVPARLSYLLPTFDGLRQTPGTYSTPLPRRLATPAGRPAPELAATLADHLRHLPWIAAVTVTGPAYLRLSVTSAALADLAARITAAGRACARSDALAHHDPVAARVGGWHAATTWAQAHALTAAEVTSRCAAAAGAPITSKVSERLPRERHATETVSAPDGATPSVAEFVAFAGRDAIRYALCRTGHPARPGSATLAVAVRHHRGNPGYAVRYAHAHAAATLRQAAGLGIDGTDGTEAAGCEARLLGHPLQRALLHVLSWLPERVAHAARRAEPRVLARYLEDLACAYYAAHETCPALPYAGGPDEPAAAQARLRLAAAVKTGLATGLDLLGVSAPDVL